MCCKSTRDKYAVKAKELSCIWNIISLGKIRRPRIFPARWLFDGPQTRLWGAMKVLWRKYENEVRRGGAARLQILRSTKSYSRIREKRNDLSANAWLFSIQEVLREADLKQEKRFEWDVNEELRTRKLN